MESSSTQSPSSSLAPSSTNAHQPTPPHLAVQSSPASPISMLPQSHQQQPEQSRQQALHMAVPSVPSAPSASPNDSLAPQPKRRLVAYAREALEALYRIDPHPPTSIKRQLAAQYGIDVRRIVVWFQNRRQLARRRGEFVPSAHPAASAHIPTTTAPMLGSPTVTAAGVLLPVASASREAQHDAASAMSSGTGAFTDTQMAGVDQLYSSVSDSRSAIHSDMAQVQQYIQFQRAQYATQHRHEQQHQSHQSHSSHPPHQLYQVQQQSSSVSPTPQQASSTVHGDSLWQPWMSSASTDVLELASTASSPALSSVHGVPRSVSSATIASTTVDHSLAAAESSAALSAATDPLRSSLVISDPSAEVAGSAAAASVPLLANRVLVVSPISALPKLIVPTTPVRGRPPAERKQPKSSAAKPRSRTANTSSSGEYHDSLSVSHQIQPPPAKRIRSMASTTASSPGKHCSVPVVNHSGNYSSHVSNSSSSSSSNHHGHQLQQQLQQLPQQPQHPLQYYCGPQHFLPPSTTGAYLHYSRGLQLAYDSTHRQQPQFGNDMPCPVASSVSLDGQQCQQYQQHQPRHASQHSDQAPPLQPFYSHTASHSSTNGSAHCFGLQYSTPNETPTVSAKRVATLPPPVPSASLPSATVSDTPSPTRYPLLATLVETALAAGKAELAEHGWIPKPTVTHVDIRLPSFNVLSARLQGAKCHA